ncbi:MAG: response regulator transcription factor [Blautia sp.]|nr:response regulator transcription factor [Blautia sp.]
MKLLLAEDTVDLNRVVTAMLEHAGFDVDPVYDGEEALSMLLQNGYDGVILDIMMPKRDGISVLTEMRRQNIITPVLMLTAKAEIDDRVAGLEAGADDYLPKPFAMKELLARVKAMTRRRMQYSTANLTYEDISLNAETLELSAENTVRLSIKEFELMQTLILAAEKELSASYLLSHVWSAEPEADEDTMRLYIAYLRRKLKSVASVVEISETEQNRNYKLCVHRD